MLEAILVQTIFNSIPIFDPFAIDYASHQKMNHQKIVNHRPMEHVKKLTLDDSPQKCHVKTTGFFDNMCCALYSKEHVSSDAIELVFDSGEQPSVIQRAFAWTEDMDENDGDEVKYVEFVEYCTSDDEVLSRNSARADKAFETNSLVSFKYHAKSPSGTASTATTVTMNTYNTIESWESLNTHPASASYEEEVPESNSPPPRTIAVPCSSNEKEVPESNSPPPLKIAVLCSKSNQRKQFPSLPSDSSMRRMRFLSVANYAY
jgi:hypothetical protein